MFGRPTFNKLIDEYQFETVLDIGCGQGEHTDLFRVAGKQVTAIDHGRSIYFRNNSHQDQVTIGDFLDVFLKRSSFDCVWASHVLEHQQNVGLFLHKIYMVCKQDGIVAITVPPFSGMILGGHLTAWNAGLLLYNMVLAGFDCSEARILSKDFDICLIVRKKPADLPVLAYDNGDVNLISRFLPGGLRENFDGNIASLNW